MFSNITALNATDDLNVYEYIPNPPLEFQTNDILGLYQPRISDTEVVMYYQRGGGPQNFRSDQDSPLTNASASGGGGNDLPLVAVEVNGKMNFFHCPMQENYNFVLICYVVFLGGSAGNCTEGFITRDRLADEALLIGNFADPKQDSQQLIIPNTTFSRNGSVVR